MRLTVALLPKCFIQLGPLRLDTLSPCTGDGQHYKTKQNTEYHKKKSVETSAATSGEQSQSRVFGVRGAGSWNTTDGQSQCDRI